MKKRMLFFASAFSLCAWTAQAQTFTSLAADGPGDNVYSQIKDLKGLSYRVNDASDSIWFKIETYNAMLVHMDAFGFELGIDTDLVTTNGTAWEGPNTAMQYDHSLFMSYDGYDDTILYVTNNGISGTLVHASVERPDDFTLIVGFRMTDIDDDGNFNLLLGSADFDDAGDQVFDDAPDAGYIKIRDSATSVVTLTGAGTMALYPNPATAIICWSSSASRDRSSSGSITDLTGRVLQTINAAEGQADISALPAGTYLLHMGAGSSMFTKK